MGLRIMKQVTEFQNSVQQLFSMLEHINGEHNKEIVAQQLTNFLEVLSFFLSETAAEFQHLNEKYARLNGQFIELNADYAKLYRNYHQLYTKYRNRQQLMNQNKDVLHH
jgi:predicted nuclease with TOPRIM domain